MNKVVIGEVVVKLDRRGFENLGGLAKGFIITVFITTPKLDLPPFSSLLRRESGDENKFLNHQSITEIFLKTQFEQI
jgi:hypothetical protein